MKPKFEFIEANAVSVPDSHPHLSHVLGLHNHSLINKEHEGWYYEKSVQALYARYATIAFYPISAFNRKSFSNQIQRLIPGGYVGFASRTPGHATSLHVIKDLDDSVHFIYVNRGSKRGLHIEASLNVVVLTAKPDLVAQLSNDTFAVFKQDNNLKKDIQNDTIIQTGEWLKHYHSLRNYTLEQEFEKSSQKVGNCAAANINIAMNFVLASNYIYASAKTDNTNTITLIKAYQDAKKAYKLLRARERLIAFAYLMDPHTLKEAIYLKDKNRYGYLYDILQILIKFLNKDRNKANTRYLRWVAKYFGHDILRLLSMQPKTIEKIVAEIAERNQTAQDAVDAIGAAHILIDKLENKIREHMQASDMEPELDDNPFNISYWDKDYEAEKSFSLQGTEYITTRSPHDGANEPLIPEKYLQDILHQAYKRYLLLQPNTANQIAQEYNMILTTNNRLNQLETLVELILADKNIKNFEDYAIWIYETTNTYQEAQASIKIEEEKEPEDPLGIMEIAFAKEAIYQDSKYIGLNNQNALHNLVWKILNERRNRKAIDNEVKAIQALLANFDSFNDSRSTRNSNPPQTQLHLHSDFFFSPSPPPLLVCNDYAPDHLTALQEYGKQVKDQVQDNEPNSGCCTIL